MTGLTNIHCILVRPKTSGNLGAIARVMKNFGFSKLILVDPKCKTDTMEARKRAKHAQDVLKGANSVTLRALKNYDTLVGTTAKVSSDYNIPRLPLLPKQAAPLISGSKGKIGLVFGPEGDGLTNEEIQLCDFTITIPTNPKYKTLNVSHSIALILYEIYQASNETKSTDHISALPASEKRLLLQKIKKLLNRIDFKTSDKRKTQVMLWNRLIGKGFLTRREGYALFGFFDKIKPKQ